MSGGLEDKFYLHWLNLLPELGPKRLWLLKQYFGSFEAAAGGKVTDFLAASLPRRIAYATAAHCSQPGLLEKIIAAMDKVKSLGITIMAYEDDGFPPPLRELAVPPLLLYCRGDLTGITDKVFLAIVGSRRPTAYGLKVTEQLVADLSAAGVVIVSGLAFGIDIAAHRAALKNKGRTP